MKFAVTGFPKTRSKWASAFLSTPECPVIHDARPEQIAGACAIATPLVITHWSMIDKDVPIAFIDRPYQDMMRSLDRYNIHEGVIPLILKGLPNFMKARNVKTFDYYNLDAGELWEFCHGTKVSSEYIRVFEDMIITQKSMETLRRVA